MTPPQTPPTYRFPPAFLVVENGPEGGLHRMSWRIFRRDPNQKLHQNDPNRNKEGGKNTNSTLYG